MDNAATIASEKTRRDGYDGLPEIGARLDRLGTSRYVWWLVALLAAGGLFESYLISTGGGIAPGLIKSGLLTDTTKEFFSMKGFAGFSAATFTGLLLASSCFGVLADRFGRRAIFTFALLLFSISGVIMVFQHTANGLIFWRFMVALGAGVEVITIDAYLSELMPRDARGRAFAVNNAIHSCGKPLAAFAAFALVPYAFFNIDGWRWVVILGSVGALVIWPLRQFIPESPRWLAAHGRREEAEKIVSAMEARIEKERGAPLPPPQPVTHRPPHIIGRYAQIFSREYLPRTLMLSVFHVLQAIGLFGFVNWMPTFLMKQGVSVTESLGYTFGMALVTPLGPLACMGFADKMERKWQIVASALVIAVVGLVFANSRDPMVIVPAGAIELLAAAVLNYSFHAYQAELFPTRIRVQAVGFVYSWSRVSAVFTGFLIAFMLREYGVPAVFVLFTGSMLLVALFVTVWGPKTQDRSLETLSP
ncbi:MAG TPA: MFS transporter [Caulobacteraceae bacterium]|nr:MFS transporter [Caulobacteraceae bacterium]